MIYNSAPAFIQKANFTVQYIHADAARAPYSQSASFANIDEWGELVNGTERPGAATDAFNPNPPNLNPPDLTLSDLASVSDATTKL